MNETIDTPISSGKPPIHWTNILMWAAVLGILALVGWGLVNANATRPEAGQPAPGFDMQFFSGYELDGNSNAKLDDLKGQIVVLNFWAAWCVPCRDEAPILEAAWQKYRDQGVTFLGIAYADVEPNSIAFMQEFGITYPNAPDLGTDISQDYEITGVPETFIIDRDGTIIHVQIGPIDAATLNGTIESLLEN